MNKFLRNLISAALLVSISACGGSSHHKDSTSPVGVWENISNFIISDNVQNCFDISPDMNSFQDYHTINQINENTYEVISNSDMINAYGSLDENNNLTFEEYYEGDIFGDGSFCTYSVKLTYAQSKRSTFETIYNRSLTCNDGYMCEDKAIGQSSPANL